ncbi:MAG: hypothetical protein LUH09_09480 [Clostridiales bacterium]|nr:hypothetical protein [Clostridiales bacterium]
MANTLSTLSIVSFALAGVCLVLAVFFWVFFQIPTVIGDLSGRTARKSIEKMRAANEKTSSKSYRTGKINTARGVTTAPIPKQESAPTAPIPRAQAAPSPRKDTPDGRRPETGLLGENRATRPPTESTTLLETEGTAFLMDEEETTDPLGVSPQQSQKARKRLVMLDDVMLTHTDEVLE